MTELPSPSGLAVDLDAGVLRFTIDRPDEAQRDRRRDRGRADRPSRAREPGRGRPRDPADERRRRLLQRLRHREPQRDRRSDDHASGASNAGSPRRRIDSSRSCSPRRCRSSPRFGDGRPGSASISRSPPTSASRHRDARFWEPFAKRGFTPDSGGTWLLPRLVGVARAKELLRARARALGRRSRRVGPGAHGGRRRRRGP